MKITKIQSSSCDLMYHLDSAIGKSRFNAEFALLPYNKGINISRVRLKSSKEYCGNHAKACENTIRKDRKGNSLEGADWVEFNDLLNEVCDRLKIACDIASAKGAGCIIRKQQQRRIRYDADTFVGRPGNGEWRWNYDGPDNHFACHFDSAAPPSAFPSGTPGIYVQYFHRLFGDGRDYNVVG